MSSTSNEARYEAVFNACYQRVLHYAQRRVDEQTAQDVTAETMLLAWRRLSELPDQPLPWLLASTRRILANRRRGETRHHQMLEKLRRQPEPDPAMGESEESYDENAWWRWALSRLPPRDQELLTLLAWDGLTHAEAAEVLGCRPTTFAMRLARARQRLVRALGAEAPRTVAVRTTLRPSEERS